MIYTTFSTKDALETVSRALKFTPSVSVTNVSGSKECYQIECDLTVVCSPEEERHVLEFAHGANGESLSEPYGC